MSTSAVEIDRPQRRTVLERGREFAADLLTVGPPIALLVAVYVLIDRTVIHVTDLGSDGYQARSLLVEWVRQHAILVALVVAVAGLVVGRSRSLGPRWPAFDEGASVRLLVGAPILVLTWAFVAYDYNLYLDRWHLLDRSALLVLGVLALWRPLFVLPWIVVVMVILNQFWYPIGGYSTAEPLQLVRIAELFVALYFIRLVVGKWYLATYLFTVVALLAGAYWESGLGKVRLGWLDAGPHLDSLLLAGYANGWLGFLSEGSISDVGRVIGSLMWPMFVAGVVIELGAIVMLWGRVSLVGWLSLFIVFHLGVLGLTGIFFWKWILFEVMLLVVLLRGRLISRLPIFDLSHAVIGTLLILVAPVWSRPVSLSWLDSPVSYAYRFDAMDTEGDRVTVAPDFWGPYGYHFSVANFGYLTAETRLPIALGATRDRSVAEELYHADDAIAVLAIESTFGADYFDPSRAEIFDEFVTAYVSNWNERRSRASGFSLLQAPPQLWGFGSSADPIDDVVHVTIREVTTFWDGHDYTEIRQLPIREIDIPAGR